MYDLPLRILSSCAPNVVLLPSGASHFPVNVPPTPVANGVSVISFGLLSLNAAPKKPHTPPAVGITVAPAWICAATRLSKVSAVCDPVTSILKIVAVNDIAVRASFNMNVATPKDAGRGAPVEVVG